MAYHWPKELLICHCTLLSWASGTVNLDYNVTNSLLIGSRCITNGTYLTIVEPIWPTFQEVSKLLVSGYAFNYFCHGHNYMYLYTENYPIYIYVHIAYMGGYLLTGIKKNSTGFANILYTI